MDTDLYTLFEDPRFIMAVFPDWNELQPGTWSKYGIHSDINDHIFEIGLYREPLDNYDEYSGTYTLQGFYYDDVIICHTVNM